MSRVAFLAACAGAMLTLGPLLCDAQDFSAPEAAGPSASPLALLDNGLPAAGRGLGAEGATASWFTLPELTTRSLAISISWRGARGAAGLSQTGDPELGWTALGLALGGAGGAAGGAVRAVARRDRHPRPEDGPLGPGVGLEAGAGMWMEAGGGIRVWAAAPQIWLRGEGPPLARGLEIGGMLRAREIGGWLAQRSPPHGEDAPAEREAGLLLESGPCAAWARARDHPLRGGIGLSARALRVAAAVEVMSHAVLGETVLLSLSIPATPGVR